MSDWELKKQYRYDTGDSNMTIFGIRLLTGHCQIVYPPWLLVSGMLSSSMSRHDADLHVEVDSVRCVCGRVEAVAGKLLQASK